MYAVAGMVFNDAMNTVRGQGWQTISQAYPHGSIPMLFFAALKLQHEWFAAKAALVLSPLELSNLSSLSDRFRTPATLVCGKKRNHLVRVRAAHGPKEARYPSHH